MYFSQFLHTCIALLLENQIQSRLNWERSNFSSLCPINLATECIHLPWGNNGEKDFHWTPITEISIFRVPSIRIITPPYLIFAECTHCFSVWGLLLSNVKITLNDFVKYQTGGTLSILTCCILPCVWFSLLPFFKKRRIYAVVLYCRKCFCCVCIYIVNK